MDFQAKIEELRAILNKALLPIMGNKVILVDAPYYNNIGDVLIWQGTFDFLKKNGIRLLSCTSGDTFQFQDIPSDVTLLLMGGGNFGDLWRDFQKFRLSIIGKYRNNRIIMLPQSVCYQDEDLIQGDAEVFANHPDLHLCARDKASYKLLNERFSSNHIYLLPDMAFYISDEILQPYRDLKTDKTLFFKRLDKELDNLTPKNVSATDQRDWPTFEKYPPLLKILGHSILMQKRIGNKKIRKLLGAFNDKAAENVVRKHEVKVGLKFLSPFKFVISTRLHALIMAVLIHTPVAYINNTTGKLSAFADTWLKDLSAVKPYE